MMLPGAAGCSACERPLAGALRNPARWDKLAGSPVVSRPAAWSPSGCYEVLQARPDLRAAQAGEGVALDLAGALTGEPHDRTDLLERPGRAGVEPEAQDQHLPLALGEVVEHLLEGLPADRLDGQLVRPDRGVVLQEVLQGGAVVADGRVQRGDRLGGVLEA